MFDKTDYKIIKTDTLKRLFKINNIKNVSKLKKIELFEEYNKLLSCKLIQNKFRNYFYKNAVDNITLENVTFPCFIYRVKSGKCFFYQYDSIIKYIMKTGKVIDPNTRNEYTDSELTRLDSEAKLHFPEKNFKSTLKIKKNESYARKIRNRENEILTFQMRLDEIKVCILTIIEDNILSWNLTESLIIDNIEYRNFTSYVNSIIHELRILFLNLKSYNQFEANCFKTNFLCDINNNSEYFKGIVSKL